MTPGARVSAAIAVLDRVAAGEPAEKALTNWARGARYAGSKDRAAVRDHVFDVLRRWRSTAAAGGSVTGRGRMIGLLREDGPPPEVLFDGQGHAPAPLSEEELAAGAAPDRGLTQRKTCERRMRCMHFSLALRCRPALLTTS